MMDMEIFDDFSGSNDQMIVKGKRTKRLRPSSSASSSGGGGGGEFNYNNNNYSYNSLASSPATSSEISTSTEEDEDMANCLILLARGGFSPRSEGEIKPQVSSRKFAEMAATTNGKVGIYVYECKTCSRTFPSFQALGGHRASHKKPKAAGDVDRRKPPQTARRPDEEEEKIRFNKSNTVTPSTSAQIPNHVENKPKLHECSICGSEFASGQALGGHMRRHRSAINVTATRSGCDDDAGEKISRNNMLELDLNLPAPAEDDRRETEFRQFSSPRHVFSSAALVDCHY